MIVYFFAGMATGIILLIVGAFVVARASLDDTEYLDKAE